MKCYVQKVGFKATCIQKNLFETYFYNAKFKNQSIIMNKYLVIYHSTKRIAYIIIL